MIKFAKYIKSTWCTVWCVFKYLQATWVKHTHTRPQNICFPDEESTVLALNPYYRKKQNKTKQILIQKLTLKWHLLWIIAGCWPVCIKALWNGADVSQWPSNLICRGGKKNSRSDAGRTLEEGGGDWGCSAGGGERENLRILATCCFWQHHGQREGSTLFFFSLFDCKQWGDLNLLTTAMATDFKCQPSSGIDVFFLKKTGQN